MADVAGRTAVAQQAGAAGGAAPETAVPSPGEPVLRWTGRAHSIAEIERELARIWATPKLTQVVDGREERHIAARTSVMNLVVIARRPEIAVHCADTIARLTGRHPSRTLICSPADPDGPSWLDAQIQAHCMLPTEGAAEVCAETIFLTAGGASGMHLEAVVAPLLIHDLPVTVWWPGEPPFGTDTARRILRMADRLVVDGSTWEGDGLARLGQMAAVAAERNLAVSDFALVRQERWREAIASIFDLAEFQPYLRSLRRVSVTYATHDEQGRPGMTNVVKPVYHVAWLASRLGMTVSRPLAPIERAAVAPAALARSTARTGPAGTPLHRGLGATLRTSHHEVDVVIRPLLSPMPAGTTLRVELRAERRGSELRAGVTAEAEIVRARVWQDGIEALDRTFRAPRLGEVELLAEAIEATGRSPLELGTIQAARELTAAVPGPRERRRGA